MGNAQHVGWKIMSLLSSIFVLVDVTFVILPPTSVACREHWQLVTAAVIVVMKQI
jgi:hypothetical protein